MHSYDVLYSISDLHLGGAAKADPAHPNVLAVQATGAADRLAKWIRRITPSEPDTRPIGLVINGDFIDFLAENPQQYLDLVAPRRHVDRVVKDPSFAPVFGALADFVAAPRTRLVVVIGNHDVELLHPEAQHALLEVLRYPSTEKFEFALDGTGYTCRVGGRRVYCTHGNEHDAFNLLDHRALRRLLQRAKRGESLRQEEIRDATNAGTRLVVDVMNAVKRELPFVDLLKPEIEAVIPMLLSLPRDRVPLPDLDRAIAIALRRSYDAARMSNRLLSERQAEQGRDDAVSSVAWSRAAWESLEQQYQQSTAPIDIARAEGSGTLSVAGALWGAVRAQTSEDGLRAYLLQLMKKQGLDTFRYDVPSDELFVALDREVDPSVDFVLAGHTHLARLIKRCNGVGYYCNTGTWMRLLRLSPALLENDAAWKSAQVALLDPRIEKIDEWAWTDAPAGVAAHDTKLLLDRCTVAKISHDAGSVKAELLVVGKDGSTQREPVFGADPAVLPAKGGA